MSLQSMSEMGVEAVPEEKNIGLTGATVTVHSPREGGRLEFLDAARGIAAFAVVVQHSLETCIPASLTWAPHHVDFGAVGVVMFFLVSGFIIPVSLERAGKLTTFWGSRFFRLYPIYWASLIVALVLGHFRLLHLPPAFLSHPIAATIANVTMLQEYLRFPDALGVYWTLSLELAFYVLCSVLFAFGWLRRSLLWAWVASAVMISGVLVAGLVFHRSLPAGRLGLLVTAFLGTVVFRVYSRQMDKKVLYPVLIGTAVTLLTGFWFRFHMYPSRVDVSWNMRGVTVSWLLAYVLFGLLLALRKREFPAWLLWLGRISYSLYLVHGVVLGFLPKGLHPAVFVLVAAVSSIAVSAITYQFIEKPAIDFYRSRRRRGRLSQGSAS